MSDNYLLMDTEVKKDFVLGQLKENLEKHKKDFEEAHKGFLLEAQEQAEYFLESIKGNPATFTVPKKLIKLRRPRSHVRTYERQIAMLEKHVHETIEMSGDQYAAFVDDDWEWREKWQIDNTQYITKSREGPKSLGVLSGYTATSKHENKLRHGRLLQDLQKKGLRPQSLKGKWEGVAEKSVIVPGIAAKDIFEMGRRYGQDAVIYKGPDGIVGMYDHKNGKVTLAVDPKANPAVAMAAQAAGQDLYSKARGTEFSIDFLWGQDLPWDGRNPVTKDQVIGYLKEGKLNFA